MTTILSRRCLKDSNTLSDKSYQSLVCAEENDEGGGFSAIFNLHLQLFSSRFNSSSASNSHVLPGQFHPGTYISLSLSLSPFYFIENKNLSDEKLSITKIRSTLLQKLPVFCFSSSGCRDPPF